MNDLFESVDLMVSVFVWHEFLVTFQQGIQDSLLLTILN